MNHRHRRKSKHYSVPMNSVPTAPLRFEHPLRGERAAECFLVFCFIASVRGTWVDCAGAADEEEAEVLWKLAARLVPGAVKHAKSELLQAGFQGQVPTILWAATDWIRGLELPADEADLWNGPPILQRRLRRA